MPNPLLGLPLLVSAVSPPESLSLSLSSSLCSPVGHSNWPGSSGAETLTASDSCADPRCLPLQV